MTGYQVCLKITIGEASKTIGMIVVCANRDMACVMAKDNILRTGFSKKKYSKCVRIIAVKELNLEISPGTST